MTSDQIWVSANCHRELIRTIYRALIDGKDINAGMTQLKSNIPCLFGIDFEKKGLVFRSTDEGFVVIFVEEKGVDFVLVHCTNIQVT